MGCMFSESLNTIFDRELIFPVSLSTPALSVGGSILMTAAIFDGSGLRARLLKVWQAHYFPTL